MTTGLEEDFITTAREGRYDRDTPESFWCRDRGATLLFVSPRLGWWKTGWTTGGAWKHETHDRIGTCHGNSITYDNAIV